MRVFAGGRNVMLATGEYPSPPAPRVHWIFVSAISRSELAQVIPSLERGLSSPPKLAYFGRLSHEKGVHNLVQAVAELQRTGFGPMPKVLIIGDGPQRSILEDMARNLNIAPAFTFTGQLDRSDLSSNLLQADLCVIPSLTESYCKARLDAMLHGLPVLTTDVGSARGIIGQNGERGWIVPPDDVPHLTQKLREILTTDIDWPMLRRRCRSYVEGRTLEDWAETIGRISAAQWGWQFEEGKLSP